MSLKTNRASRDYRAHGGMGCATTQHTATLYSSKQPETTDDPALYRRVPSARFVPVAKSAYVDYRQAARDITAADARAALKAKFSH